MKKMLILLFSILPLFATDVFWHDSYKDAYEEAQELNKPILMFLSLEGCKSCEYMDDVTLSDEKITAYLDKHYICVHLDIRADYVPQELQVSATPVFHFLDKEGKPFKESLLGRKDVETFYKAMFLQ